MLTDCPRGLQQASNSLKIPYQTPSNTPARKHGPTLLIVDDEAVAHARLNSVLSSFQMDERLQILHANSIPEALACLSEQPVHVAILDKTLESNFGQTTSAKPENGIEAIPDFLKIQPHLQILMLTGSQEIPDVVRAMNLGAFNYITKETPDEFLVLQIEKALQVALLKLDRERRARLVSPDLVQLGGHSKAFKKLLKNGESFVRGSTPLLLLGPTGSGKTQFAQWFHEKRCNYLNEKDLPFQPVNVSTLSKTLIESELFGHDKSAFTGAGQMKRGLFEIVQNGTLFLDEIGELPLELQSKLLTVIDQGIFNRVGGTQILTTHARIIFATHRNLEKMVAEGTFREDLYDRISALTLEMPSLDERREDIPDIIQAMLPNVCKAVDVQVAFSDLPTDFIEYMQISPKNKNLRILRNQLQLFLMSAPRDPKDNPVFTRWRSFDGFSDSPKAVQANTEVKEQASLSYQEFKSRPRNLIGSEFPGLNEIIEDLKVSLIQEATQKFETRRDMANALGLGETTFSMLIKRYPELDKNLKARGKKNRGRDFSASNRRRSHELNP